ncbi:MAG: CaiB/BaiF CoA-transferase family protein [Novosphingobium sp.]|nr:CoA transferase [Novosphingobium sp.]
MEERQGPLAGIKVIEFSGIGPAPMCAMLLADLGAEVIAVDRPQQSGLGIERPREFDLCRRSRSSISIDLKAAEGVACALDLICRADAVIEGFRPGVMERLGLGPEVCCERNPRLVYGRVTGWGQDGPLARSAGHDLNYIAVSGALAQFGRAGEPPMIPLNLVGDFGGGAMFLAFGIACALLEAARSGKGQVVDASVVEGTATLLTGIYGLFAAGLHARPRGENLLDGGAPHYNVYRCADGEWITIAAIEAKFRKDLLVRIGFDPANFPDVEDRRNWPYARRLLQERFAQRPQSQWCELLLGTDACFAPVLGLSDAAAFAHNSERKTLIEIDGIVQPAPAPRFSRTPAGVPTAPEEIGSSTVAVLKKWGIPVEEIALLADRGIIPPPHSSIQSSQF